MPRKRPVFEIIPEATAEPGTVTISQPSPWLFEALKLIDGFEAAVEECCHPQAGKGSEEKCHKARTLLVCHLKARDDRA